MTRNEQPITTQADFEAFVVRMAMRRGSPKFKLDTYGWGDTKRWVLEETGPGHSYRGNNRVFIPSVVGEALAEVWKRPDPYGPFIGAVSAAGLAKRYDEVFQLAGTVEKKAKAATVEQRSLEMKQRHDVPISAAANTIKGMLREDIFGGLTKEVTKITDKAAKQAVEELIAKAREVHEILRAAAQVHDIKPLD